VIYNSLRPISISGMSPNASFYVVQQLIFSAVRGLSSPLYSCIGSATEPSIRIEECQVLISGCCVTSATGVKRIVLRPSSVLPCDATADRQRHWMPWILDGYQHSGPYLVA